MNNFIKNLLNAARRFTATDFAVFKICLLSIGILLGSYFSCFFQNYVSVLWIVAVIAWLVLMVQIIRYYKR